MSQHYVTKQGTCTYCGSQLKLCEVCQEWFLAKNKRHKICRSRCRTKKHRLKLLESPANV